jgi:protein-disulfide isomerase
MRINQHIVEIPFPIVETEKKEHYLMTIKNKIVLSVALLALACTGASAQNFSNTQKTDIEKIVHQYLTDNPEVLVEASQAYKDKQMQEMKTKANAFISTHKSAFFSDKNAPVAGNPKGNVTLVEFFDYQCGHCKQMASTVQKLIRKDKNLRVVFKELPIFKGNSMMAAKAALAANQQSKFIGFHDGMMTSKQPLNDKNIMAIANSNGLDVSRLKKDMASTRISKQIEDNMGLAQSFLQSTVGYVFTPIFVVGNQSGSKFQFIPGGLDYQNLTKIINEMRSSN